MFTEKEDPADAPSYVRIAGAGTSMMLTRDAPAAPLVLRLPSLVPHPDTAEMPIGCRAQPMALDPCDFVDRALPPPLAPLESLFDAAAPSEVIISRASGESSQWGVGRAGMLYRDLVPSRAGGALIASHIRIPDGGPVPDYVHFHRVQFHREGRSSALGCAARGCAARRGRRARALPLGAAATPRCRACCSLLFLSQGPPDCDRSCPT